MLYSNQFLFFLYFGFSLLLLRSRGGETSSASMSQPLLVSHLSLHHLYRSYKVRFNSVSSYSDTRKSSSDEPEAKINFESTGPLANVR